MTLEITTGIGLAIPKGCFRSSLWICLDVEAGLGRAYAKIRGNEVSAITLSAMGGLEESDQLRPFRLVSKAWTGGLSFSVGRAFSIDLVDWVAQELDVVVLEEVETEACETEGA